MLIKRIRPEISAFKYSANINEVCLVSDLSFCLNLKTLKFGLDQNQHGEENLVEIFNLIHNDDFSEIKFECNYRSKPATFILSSKYECDKILYRLLINGFEKNFQVSKNDLDKLEIVFDQGKLETLRLTKSVDYTVVDSMTISKKEGESSLILFNPWRKMNLISFALQEDTLVSQTDNSLISYKVGLQPFILDIIKQLTSVTN